MECEHCPTIKAKIGYKYPPRVSERTLAVAPIVYVKVWRTEEASKGRVRVYCVAAPDGDLDNDESHRKPKHFLQGSDCNTRPLCIQVVMIVFSGACVPRTTFREREGRTVGPQPKGLTAS